MYQTESPDYPEIIARKIKDSPPEILNHSDNALLEELKHRAKALFSNARGSHDWEHSLRVARLCRQIGSREGADMFIVLGAAYLHDIGRCAQDKTDGALCHAEKGAKMVQPILKELGVTESQQDNIIHCVRSHRFRSSCAPETVEAKVLFDADKLDAIGAVGVARAYLFAGELGACLHNPDADASSTLAYTRDDTGYREFVVKLQKIKDHTFTRTGKALALERHEFMVRFFHRFLEEYEGMR